MPGANAVKCECAQPGFCSRYGKHMRRRVWQICQGIDCDAGTSAHFRALWGPLAYSEGAPRSIALQCSQQPGDVLCMTAAIRSLHLTYPGRYTVSVETPYPSIFWHSPDVVATPGEQIAMHYPAIHASASRGIHFMQAWCEHLGEALHVPLPLVTNRPALYFDSEAVPNDYWLVCPDVSDFTAKRWDGWQEVVDSLPHLRFLQVGLGGAPLHGVTDATGQTSLRELFDLTRGCRGVLCGVSLLMHIAAAVEKPAVVIAGGREPVQWNAYPKQHYVHSVGDLPCAKPCWKRTIEECEHPIGVIPKCMPSPRLAVEIIKSRSIESS